MKHWGEQMIFFDGGTGSLLFEAGLAPGVAPETWNIEHPEVLLDIHRRYFEAGADIVMANTFGANRLKLGDCGYTPEQVITAAVQIARRAGSGLVALDIGPTGKLLAPLGDLDFDDAVDVFAEMVRAGAAAGADVVHIETMSDLYELKAAVLAAKENASLPVFATVVFDEKGKLLTGGSIACVVALLEGLGVDAIGINCGLGPIQMKELVREMLALTKLPVIVNPNAGLPHAENGQTVYDIDADTFAQTMRDIAEMGAWAVGGCCGTTPEHIAKTVALCRDIRPKPIAAPHRTWVASYARAVEISDDPVIIGERINPTGKKRFQAALRSGDMDYILREGLAQQQSGAHILDVNVGLPELDEPKTLVEVMERVQGVIDLPLQLDTSDAQALAAALRRYNGKAMINSVNGKEESMRAVFPLVRKYGGVVVGLTLDEEGIPDTAEGRFRVAEKIVNRAAEYGIAREDIVIDVLCMTISSDPQGACTTLAALRMVKERLGVRTILGVSNISFGLPRREIINANFYAQALAAGLDAAIINPNADAMLRSYYAYRALAAKDANCADYIEKYSGTAEEQRPKNDGALTLSDAIEHGMRDPAYAAAQELLKSCEPLSVINEQLVPALDRVGRGFEEGRVFLPQLLMSAEAARAAFDAVKEQMVATGGMPARKGRIVLATVQGDIHDIGKNIVKVLLENYGFDILDLGRDVAPETVVETARREKIRLVGLSALMTTTVPAMAETIRQLRAQCPDCRVMVGGAVLTQEYAAAIGADFYSKDAMGSVHYAEQLFGG